MGVDPAQIITMVQKAFLDILLALTTDLSPLKACRVNLSSKCSHPLRGKKKKERKREVRLWMWMGNERGGDRVSRHGGCSAGWDPTKSFCGATNQSAICESELVTCVCRRTAAKCSRCWRRIKEWAKAPTGVGPESVLLLIHLNSLFGLFNEHSR